MRFAAVQIPSKIGALLLNGEKLASLHFVPRCFGQFAVLNARSHRFLHASICKAARDTTSSRRDEISVTPDKAAYSGRSLGNDALAHIPAARW